MAKRMTKGAKTLTCDIEETLRDKLTERVKAESRTVRAVVERALKMYLATPLEGELAKQRAK